MTYPMFNPIFLEYSEFLEYSLGVFSKVSEAHVNFARDTKYT